MACKPVEHRDDLPMDFHETRANSGDDFIRAEVWAAVEDQIDLRRKVHVHTAEEVEQDGE